MNKNIFRQCPKCGVKVLHEHCPKCKLKLKDAQKVKELSAHH